jgi:ribosomal protein L21E
MKTKVIATILGIVFCAAFLWTTHVSADLGWYVCEVNRVGPSGSRVIIMVTDTAQSPAFTRKYCQATGDNMNQMLAVGLTAMTSGQTVSIRIDPAVNIPTIENMYLNE